MEALRLKEVNSPSLFERVFRGKTIKEVLVYTLLIFWALVNLFPLYWMFTFSFKTNTEIFGENVIGLPNTWLWQNYKDALEVGNIAQFFLNSFIVTFSTIALTIIVAIMASFALTRMIWKGRRMMSNVFMLGLTVPIHAAILPVFLVLSKFKMLNSYQALIVPYTAFALASGIMVFSSFMQDIPREMDEAACLDGCSCWGILFRIMLPILKPAMSTVGILTFIQAWNELMFATVFISASKYRTLTVGLQTLFGSYTTKWGPIGAALVMATFPTLIVYAFLSNKIQESFIAGAVKG